VTRRLAKGSFGGGSRRGSSWPDILNLKPDSTFFRRSWETGRKDVIANHVESGTKSVPNSECDGGND
jgi:hypothetical protein